MASAFSLYKQGIQWITVLYVLLVTTVNTALCVTNYSSETTSGGKACKFRCVFCMHPLRGTYTESHKHIIGLPRFENLPLQTKSIHSCCTLLWTLEQYNSDKYTVLYNSTDKV